MKVDQFAPIADVYARQSQDRDGTGLATSRQVEDAEQKCALQGWAVGERFIDDDTSAYGLKRRPGFEALLQKIQAGKVRVVVAWNLDRITRNRPDTVRFIEACKENKVMVALCRGMDMDMSTPGGLLMADLLSAIARNEIEVKSDRQRRAHEQSAADGRPPMRRAFGYNKDGTLHPVEAPVVQEVFELFLNTGSVSAVVRWLDSTGSSTTTGRAWDRASVRKMLRSVRYCSIRVHRGVEVGPGQWPAIVDEDTVRDAAALLADPARRKTTSTARRWVGARLYVCGRCRDEKRKSADFVTEPPTLATNYDHARSRIYRCDRCYLTRVAEPIDKKVLGLIRARLARDDVRDVLAGPDIDVAGLRNQRRALQLRLDALADDIEMDERTLARRSKALRARLEAVEARLDSVAVAAPLRAVAAAQSPVEAFDALDVPGKQAVVDFFVTVVVYPGRDGKLEILPRS